MPTEHFDVLIIGAGLSGIGAARHLQMRCADRSDAILEGRASIGGPWNLFRCLGLKGSRAQGRKGSKAQRLTGVRSDSDMFTLGYAFKPWEERKAIADGPSILKYVLDTATENDIERHIRFGHRVKGAAWSSADARWTLAVEVTDKQSDATEQVQISCNFLFMCSGCHRDDEGFTPDWPGLETFAGRVVHPQKWTKDVACAGQRVVVIGSGATAVTLVPELAKQAAQVTMLQRSPTYIVARPSEDALANTMRRWLPGKLAYSLTRWKRVLLGRYVFQRCRRDPAKVKRLIAGGVRTALGPEFDVAAVPGARR